ncbi:MULTISPECIES: hypothetical protein [unclassified Imperialibacter]|uniref:hypothetical protein n=1 Tax=unclassified Imperialibacter TaxID=2629706 RepID=UPI00125EF580|nr:MULTISPECIES: hypothetical protein [unclassified Imperialibacter]
MGHPGLKEASLMLNGRRIPGNLEEKYHNLLNEFGILPCPIRKWKSPADYIAVGDIMDDGFHGTLIDKVVWGEGGFGLGR